LEVSKLISYSLPIALLLRLLIRFTFYSSCAETKVSYLPPHNKLISDTMYLPCLHATLDGNGAIK